MAHFLSKVLDVILANVELTIVECKFFCPNSADNTMENRAISLGESSRDNSLIACRTSSGMEHLASFLLNSLTEDIKESEINISG
jgi:hypothetical protein